MIRDTFFGCALLLALGVFLATSGHAQQPPPAPQAAKPAKASKKAAAPAVEPVLEPKAIELLKAASDRLAAARSMRFTAVISYESPSRLGPPLVYTTTSEVTLQRPDKLRVITPGDGPAAEFYYDGKTMMAFEPAENLVAVADAPPTIDAALKAAYDSAAIYFPFTDVIVADPYKDIADGLEARLLHRPVPRGRRHDDGHGGVSPTTGCSCRSGSAPTTSCRGCSARCSATIRRDCATRWSCPTGSSIRTVPAEAFASASAPTRRASRSPARTEAPAGAQASGEEQGSQNPGRRR